MRQPSPSELSSAIAALRIDDSKINSKGWVTTECPACHRDGSSPSFRINVEKGSYKCWRCNASSSDVPLHEFIHNPKSPSLSGSLGGIADKPELDDDLVDRYHRFLLDSPGVQKDLERVRGWTEPTIRRIKMGFDGSHFWLPVKDISGELVNARMYDPFRRSKVKSYHYGNEVGTRRTVAWLPFGLESVAEHQTIWLFEGEPDCILAAQMGFPACVITGGAGTWTDEILSVVKDKRVVICYDIDAKGKRGAKSIHARLKASGIESIIIEFELSNPQYNDFSDAVIKDNRDAKWFKRIAKNAWEGASDGGDGYDPPIEVTLGGGVPGMPVVVKAHVLGTHTTPILVPSTIRSSCSMNWQPDRACRSCPMNAADGEMRIDIPAESKEVANLAAVPCRSHGNEYKRVCGIPTRCPNVGFEIGDYWQLLLLKLVPPMSERTGGESTVRAAIYVSPADGRAPEVKANQLYLFQGEIGPDVRTNEWTLLSSEARPAEDDVDSFVCDPATVDALVEVFQPKNWSLEEIENVFDQEENSMSIHVTKIYDRNLLQRLIDLTYHSVIQFKFKDSVPVRGWLNVGIIGDSRTGKSETMQRLNSYFGLGKMVMDPANMTFAGLVGGLQQVGKGDNAWLITWGLIPTNDRGIVILDETSSLDVKDISKMSGMRSSGIAELVKIRSSSTPARTRLVMGGNPRGEGRSLSSYSTCVEAFQELIGAREDVARFDCVLAVKEGINKDASKKRIGEQPQPIPVSLRRALVKYAWSRTKDQIVWAPGVEDFCVKEAQKIIDQYDSSIPIVEPSEQDLRIARLAIAVAIRTFSHAENDPDTVLVRKCHVEFAVKTMIDCFDGDLGYDKFSEFKKRNVLEIEDVIEKLKSVQRDISRTARTLLKIRRVTVNSIGMSLALDGAEAREFIASMVQLGAAEFPADDHGRNSCVSWTSGFLKVLRDIEINPPKQNTEDMF